MVKITHKQLLEINFLCKFFNLQPTEKEKKDYINHTVLGKKINKIEKNCLFQAKRKLDITVKTWIEDIKDGLIGTKEIREDFNDPYVDIILNTIEKGFRNV